MSSFGKYDCSTSLQSAIVISFRFVFRQEMELIEDLKLSLINTGFVFEETV
jgi:hypothetical protein